MPDQKKNSGGRYDRLKLLGWWDQAKLKAGRVLVVGAGAIGNEVVKNLALSGVGTLVIADMDRIELSNLSRTVLFRDRDEGKNKAQVAARAARALNPDVRALAFDADIRTDLGLGVFRRMHVVVGAVDNIDARTFMNGACWALGVPFVDGGTLSLLGQVRVIRPPDGPCYECTLSEEDYRRMQERFHCNLLTRSDVERGRAPTTSIASSVVGAIEAQKTIELLHGLPVPVGKTIVYNGSMSGGEHEMYMSEFEPRNNPWHAHNAMERWDPIIPVRASAATTTMGRLLHRARRDLGPEAVIDLRQNFVPRVRCEACGTSWKVMKHLLHVSARDAVCRQCRGAADPEIGGGGGISARSA